MQLREEELRPEKRKVKTGEVRVRKEVVTEYRQIDVPVTREEVVVERRPVRRPASKADIGASEEVRIPVTEEEVRVEKQPVVTEEVRVGRRKVQSTQKVEGTVRRERARVEREGEAKTTECEPRR